MTTIAQPAPSLAAAAERLSPYNGLVPYTQEDAEFFFGRDHERDILIANVKARRVTVVYGASGVGKTSLLRAGVEATLRKRARMAEARLGTPEFLPVVFSSWREDPVVGLTCAIRDTVFAFTGERLPVAGSLEEVISEYAAQSQGSLLVILDQFEDYDLYHPRGAGATKFDEQFPSVVNRTDLSVRFLVSVREDALARLDRFKDAIPNLWEKRIGVKPLTRAEALEAVVKPLERYNHLREGEPGATIEPGLAEQVLDEVQVGRVVFDPEGRRTLDDGRDAESFTGRTGDLGRIPDAIEAPYLQLVMMRLWDAALEDGSYVLRRSALERLGGARSIVRTHLDKVLDRLPSEEREAAADIFHYLITPSGGKIAHDVETLADWTGRTQPAVQALLDKLQGPDTRIVRAIPPPPDVAQQPVYEVFHDVLGTAILDWRTRFTRGRLEDAKKAAERRAVAERRRAHRFRVIAGIAVALLAATLGTFVVLKVTAPPRLPASVLVGRQPASVVVAAGAAWIANRSDDTVTRIDERTGEIIGAPIRVGHGPDSLAVGGGYVWVACFGGTINKISPQTGAVVASFSSRNNRENIEFGDGYLWVSNYQGPFEQIDPLTGKQVAASRGNGDYEGSVTLDGDVWFLRNDSKQAGVLGHWRTNSSSFSRVTTTGGEGPYSIVAADGYLWVSNFVDSTVTKIDPKTGTILRTIKDVGSSQTPSTMAAGFGAIWVADQDAVSLTRIDVHTGATSTHRVAVVPNALGIGANRIWVVQTASGTVSPVVPWSGPEASG